MYEKKPHLPQHVRSVGNQRRLVTTRHHEYVDGLFAVLFSLFVFLQFQVKFGDRHARLGLQRGVAAASLRFLINVKRYYKIINLYYLVNFE